MWGAPPSLLLTCSPEGRAWWPAAIGPPAWPRRQGLRSAGPPACPSHPNHRRRQAGGGGGGHAGADDGDVHCVVWQGALSLSLFETKDCPVPPGRPGPSHPPPLTPPRAAIKKRWTPPSPTRSGRQPRPPARFQHQHQHHLLPLLHPHPPASPRPPRPRPRTPSAPPGLRRTLRPPPPPPPATPSTWPTCAPWPGVGACPIVRQGCVRRRGR
jgi:hypothetical protein